jgi:dihydrofolate reductase
MRISIIAAVAENGVIGKDSQLVWNLPIDMKFFMNTTLGHCILTGRRNYESIPEKYRPLKNRTNIVVTKQPGYAEEHSGLKVANNIEDGIEMARAMGEKELFIIGGGQIYEQTLQLADRLYLTEVKHEFDGDTFFPDFDRIEWVEMSRIVVEADERNPYRMDFIILEREQV